MGKKDRHTGIRWFTREHPQHSEMRSHAKHQYHYGSWLHYSYRSRLRCYNTYLQWIHRRTWHGCSCRFNPRNCRLHDYWDCHCRRMWSAYNRRRVEQIFRTANWGRVSWFESNSWDPYFPWAISFTHRRIWSSLSCSPGLWIPKLCGFLFFRNTNPWQQGEHSAPVPTSLYDLVFEDRIWWWRFCHCGPWYNWGCRWR